MKKEKSIEQQIDEYRANIEREVSNWKYINEYGRNDPFWSDGCYMNLVRANIIYFKKQLINACVENNLPVPEEYYIPTPPVVDIQYMATLNQKERMKRIRQTEDEITTKKTKYDDRQISLF